MEVLCRLIGSVKIVDLMVIEITAQVATELAVLVPQSAGPIKDISASAINSGSLAFGKYILSSSKQPSELKSRARNCASAYFCALFRYKAACVAACDLAALCALMPLSCKAAVAMMAALSINMMAASRLNARFKALAPCGKG